MRSLSHLLRIADRREKGPAPTFDKPRLLLAFAAIGEESGIGRQAIAGRSGLGEGAVRTVLKKLREEGYASADAEGSHLTDSGKKVYKQFTEKVSPFVRLVSSGLTVGADHVAISVHGSGRKVKTGIEQRDSAIKAGAAGATTYYFRGNKFTIPNVSSDCEADFPDRAWVQLRRELKPKDGDAIIVSGGNNSFSARVGALSSALTLL